MTARMTSNEDRDDVAGDDRDADVVIRGSRPCVCVCMRVCGGTGRQYVARGSGVCVCVCVCVCGERRWDGADWRRDGDRQPLS